MVNGSGFVLFPLSDSGYHPEFRLPIQAVACQRHIHENVISCMNNNLLKYMEDGCTVLVPTVRLSRYLQYRYALASIQAGQRSWQTPDCLPWTTWLEREWLNIQQQSGQNLYLLNVGQRHWLWQEIINNSRYSDRLLHAAATARQAVAAWDTCHEYGIGIFPGEQYLNEDARAFRDWANAYEDHLRHSGYIDPAVLSRRVCDHLAGGGRLMEKIVFYGFDFLVPAQHAVIEALRSAGTNVEIIDVQVRQTSAAVCRAKNSDDEIRQIANRARQVLQENPQANIGIVCPQLQAFRQTFVYHMDALLTPASLLSPEATNDKPYNIALGRPLSAAPLVQTALNILQLGQPRVPLPVISHLLLSPFIRGWEGERDRRAAFDARLRKLGEARLSLKAVFRIAADKRKPHQFCPQFIEMLKTFDISYLSCARAQTAGGWARSFSDFIKAFQWPGDRSLNSAEYQTLEAWKETLVQFASLDRVAGRMTASQALVQLGRITADTRFQPQTAEAPIQIMGTTAAAAMQFDYLWFMDCHDQAWPPARQPNPFIPLPLQREAGMAEASAETHLLHYRELTRRLVGSAGECVISYPQQEDDRPLRASPVIHRFTGEAEVRIDDNADYMQMLQASGRLETFIDEMAPPIPEGEIAKGGSGLFRDQALCPFRAFAHHRLHAKALDTVDTGLSAAHRGQLVHDVMYRFWDVKRDSTSLDVAGDLLQKRMDAAIQKALDDFTREQPETLTGQFREIERRRLKRLLEDWLELEKNRPPFTVREVEQWHDVSYAGMQVSLRIDRIDELADGRLVIIDYKTGRVHINDWLEDRPPDPQLPLYAITTEGDVAAIVYARIKRGENRFEGLGAEEDLLPAIKLPADDWEAQKDRWRDILAQLADEYRRGIAVVQPQENACYYCDLHGLCRIHERVDFYNGENAGDGQDR